MTTGGNGGGGASINKYDPMFTRLGGAAGPADTLVGPGSVTYQVDALPAGSYFFRCDVHPTQMTGTFVIAK